MGIKQQKVLWPPDAERSPYTTACSSGDIWHMTLECGHDVKVPSKGKVPEFAHCPKGCK